MLEPLHEGWTVTALTGPVPEAVAEQQLKATVPGELTVDLLAAGLVPDPYLDANEHLLEWVGRTDWLYRTTFDAAPVAEGERFDLVCDGLDTIATIRLNGTVIGNTANMHRSYRFDLREAVVAGRNCLEVEFQAPIDAIERMSEELGPRPHVNHRPFNAIRKMACNYGWDWGPDLPTVGIWRPIGLDRWRHARIASVRPLIRVDVADPSRHGADEMWADASAPRACGAHVELHVDLEREAADDVTLTVTANVAGARSAVAVAPGQTEVVIALDLADVELWWPTGYGSQPLYDLNVTLEGHGNEGRGQANPLDSWRRRVGFRSVELDTRADADDTRLGFVVNGRTILVRGANWIPNDAFINRVDRDDYRRQLQRAVAANMNLLRVWGGGIYETEDFYELADELGLLVWQDFLLACAAYSEDEPMWSEFEAEARQAVTRLSAHPSLAAWSGGNENIWGHEDWGWKEKLDGMSWGSGYYFGLFPSIVGELDPSRPYMPGSPWSFSHDVHPNDARHGSMHVWDVWNQKDYLSYRDHQPQFVAEFGFQGPPTWSTLTRAVTERPLRLDSASMANHQKAQDGMDKLARGLASHIGEVESVEDWHWATSLNQARAVAFAIEYWRSLNPRCRGMIVWQLNDCWPVVSWAAVDSDERLKPLWYALRRVYANRILTVQPQSVDAGLNTDPESRALSVVAVNDSVSPWEQTLQVVRQTFDGRELARDTVEVNVHPGQSLAVQLDGKLASAVDPSREVLVVSGGDRRAIWFYAEDRNLALPEPDLAVRVEPAEGGFDVTVGASTLQRDVALLADRIDPASECDDMLFTLLPGESRRIHVRSAAGVPPADLLDGLVLRSANQLQHRSQTR